MRLLSEFRKVKKNIVDMGKHMRLRVRHANFKAMIEGLPNDDIMQLDSTPTSASDTSQCMIMEIKTTTTNTQDFFYLVGQD